MNRFFTLLFAASCLTAVGQVPDYVPTDGLVAWWNMYDNGLDSSPNQIHPINEGYQAGIDRFGNDAGCFDSEGTHIDYGVHPEIYNESFSFSAWINPTSATSHRTFMGYHRDQTGGATLGLVPSNQIKFHTNVIGYGNPGEQGVVSSSPLQANVWSSVVGTFSMGVLSLYLNGVLDTQLEGVAPPTNSQNDFQVGKWTGGNQFFGGLIDDVGVWNRALSDSEVLELYQASAPVIGCTDQEACNYNESAHQDDGSCHFLCEYCIDGTIWNEELQGCVHGQSADINNDGCVQLNDLLDVLSAYGDCGAENAPWACGDPLSYQGYDYATVQIGDQCWFAENLKYLPSVSQVTSGSETDSSPHAYVYGYNGTNVQEAQSHSTYTSFGALYNFEAVSEWEMCPNGWHVPSDDEFGVLEATMGMPSSDISMLGWRASNLALGNALRSNEHWVLDDGVESGIAGFHGHPSGYRISWLGDEYFENAEVYGAWWTSTADSNPQKAFHRGIASYNLGILRTAEFKQVGFAVRCLQDAE